MRLRRLADSAYRCAELSGAWRIGEVRDISPAVAARLLEQHADAFERVDDPAPPKPPPTGLADVLGARIAGALEAAGLSESDVRGMSDEDLLMVDGIGRGSLRKIRVELS